jgi:hypothetical protein
MATAFAQLNQETKLLKQQVEKSKARISSFFFLSEGRRTMFQDAEARLKALETENEVLRDDAAEMLRQILSALAPKTKKPSKK